MSETTDPGNGHPPKRDGDIKPKSKSPPNRKRGSKTSTYSVWTFPKNTLEEAIALAQIIEEKNAGKPIRSDALAQIAGFKVNDWRFLNVLVSANRYGILEGSGMTATVALTNIGSDIVAPSSPTQRQRALLLAFNKVEQFKRVAEFYAGKHIPEDEYFGNTLAREFDVPRERVETFIQVFTSNLDYLKAFAAVDGKKIVTIGTPRNREATPVHTPEAPVEGESSGVRQFLDTCFVLMPFGSWYDRYYSEIYVPAIKDAGFEPVRADGLFSTGSVMEQIWEQIRKAKVLLADLTGKNPNVFYELGLSHARRKPVVFVSGDLEDVPFDLRHLRVVIYEVREPKWDEKLRKHITAYLKNAKTDPAKSIPQPFRDSEQEEQTLEAEEPEQATARPSTPAVVEQAV
ncbi:MAG TPA: hypothetical protein VI454_15525 [Verrucomicrobiae bacterium]|jgi:hypothetical protein